MIERNQEFLLKVCFEHVVKVLHRLMQKTGRPASSVEFEDVFNRIAQSNASTLRMSGEKIAGLDSPADWLTYRSLLEGTIEFASAAAGHATVDRFIAAILDKMENQTGSNLVEVKYRLGLTRYTD